MPTGPYVSFSRTELCLGICSGLVISLLSVFVFLCWCKLFLLDSQIISFDHKLLYSEYKQKAISLWEVGRRENQHEPAKYRSRGKPGLTHGKDSVSILDSEETVAMDNSFIPFGGVKIKMPCTGQRSLGSPTYLQWEGGFRTEMPRHQLQREMAALIIYQKNPKGSC